MGGSLGLVVTGEDPCWRGRGFVSQRGVLDGHFFKLICLFVGNDRK